MPHRIAAVRLEAEAFRHLQRQQIGDEVFVARRDVNRAGLERRQPIGVDVREHAGRGAKLQQRDILTLGDGARGLRLDLDDFRIGEPADQVDIVHGEVDHDADIGHPRRKRADSRDRDRKDVLILDGALDRLHGRIEALDVPDHQRHAGATGRRDDGAALLDRRSDRLLHHHVNAARGAFDGDIAMQVRRRRDGDGIDAGGDQRRGILEAGTAEMTGDGLAALAVGIDDAGQFHPGQLGQHTRVVAAHDTHAHNADT